MKPATYDRMVDEYPYLKLPKWKDLTVRVWKLRARRMNRETLLAKRASRILAKEPWEI